MRPIKIRAWGRYGEWDEQADDYSFKMVYGDNLAFEEYKPINELLKSEEGVVYFMEWIGLLDSEGNPIYDDDIVSFIYCPKSLNERVVGKISRNEWGYPVVDNSKSMYHIQNAAWGKVIGNIYENPELLATP